MLNQHSPRKLLEISRQYARRSKGAKRRGQTERAQELMALSRFCWQQSSPLSPSPPPDHEQG